MTGEEDLEVLGGAKAFGFFVTILNKEGGGG